MRNKLRFFLPLQSTLGFGIPLQSRSNRPEGEGGSGGGTPVEPAAAPTGGGDTVSVKRAEYDAFIASGTKLKDAETKVSTLEKRWNNVEKVVRGDLAPEEKAESVKTMLSDMGYSQKQIEAYLKQNVSDEPPTRRGKDEDEDVDPRDAEIAQLKQGQQALLEQQRSTRLKELQATLHASTITHLDNPKGKLGEVLVKLKELGEGLEGEDSVEGLRDEIEKEFKDMVTSQVRTRKEATGRFDEGWFAEEAKKAADIVARKYRPLVIAIPKKLGRTAETGGADDYLLPEKPVETPSYKEGLKRADAEAKATDWAADALLRATRGTASNAV